MRLPTTESERIFLNHWEHLKYSYLFIHSALYVATDQLANLVAEVINNCPEPIKLFKLLYMSFGINQRNHPGVTHLRQLEILLPYLKLFRENDIHTFWKLCNKRSWFEFRKKHLDPLLINGKFDDLTVSYSL